MKRKMKLCLRRGRQSVGEWQAINFWLNKRHLAGRGLMYIRIVSKWGPFGFSGQADFFPLGRAVTRNMPMKRTEVGNRLTLTH
jgi:hypothetical protein